MNKVKILVDSCSDLSKELYKKYDLDVLPMNVSFKEECYLDGVDISLEQLYANVDKYGELPHTAASTIGQYDEYFKKQLDAGYDVVYVGLGSKLSTAFQNAVIAKQSYPEDRVFLVDTNTLSSAIGLVAMKAAKFRNEGKSAKEIKEECDKLVPNVVAQFTVETLDYLHKGGRCSGASKLIGHIFHVHPYIKVVDGSLIVYKKPRGPMKLAINEQLNELKAVLPNVDTDHIMITHTLLSDDLLEYFKSEVHKLVPNAEINDTVAGSVIGSHCGRGTVGVLYITK